MLHSNLKNWFTRLNSSFANYKLLRTIKNYPRLIVTPNPSLADEYVSISAKGLEIAQKITLHAITRFQNGSEFESFAHYVANDKGEVHLDQQESQGGSYEGIEPMGPFWSLVPSPYNKRKNETFLVKDPSRPFVVSLRLYDSFLPDFEQIRCSDLGCLAQTSITRWFSAPGVTEQEIKEGRIRGYLFLPPGEGPFPGIISMSGGYPGAKKFKASLLASHGFATLALKYFGIDDLPNDFRHDLFDFSYFLEAAEFLKGHQNVMANNGVGIAANCFGASIAIGLASIAPPGLIRCVSSTAGHYYTYGNFKYGNRRWKTPSDFRLRQTSGPNDSIELYHYTPSADNPHGEELKHSTHEFYNRNDISFLFLSGGNDRCLPATVLGRVSTKLLESAGHPDHQWYDYSDAGHLIENAYFPLVDISWTITDHIYYGGKQPGHERAQEDSWVKILEFLRRCLG